MGNYRFDALLFTCNLIVASFPSCRARQFFYKKVMRLKLAPGVRILSGLWLDCRGHLTIGRNTVINQRCRLDARGTMSIGANVSISPEVHLLTADHNLKSDNLEGLVREIRIEDFVFIGSRAIVLPGVKIGQGAAVGAGAVVTRDVEEFTVVAGSPARVIGTRPKTLKYETFYERHFF